MTEFKCLVSVVLIKSSLVNFKVFVNDLNVSEISSQNILGSFLIGYFITSNIGDKLSENFIKFFLIIGLLGSFTTFSAFSYEVLDLINSKKYFNSFTYIFISIFICIISAYFGTLLNKL